LSSSSLSSCYNFYINISTTLARSGIVQIEHLPELTVPTKTKRISIVQAKGNLTTPCISNWSVTWGTKNFQSLSKVLKMALAIWPQQTIHCEMKQFPRSILSTVFILGRWGEGGIFSLQIESL